MVSLKVFSEFDFNKPIDVYHKRSDVLMVLKFMKNYGHSIDKIYIHFCEGDTLLQEYSAEHFMGGNFEFPKFLNEELISEIYEQLPERMAEARFSDGGGRDECQNELDEMSDHELFEAYCDYNGLYDTHDVENDELAKKCQSAYENFEANRILAEEIKNGSVFH